MRLRHAVSTALLLACTPLAWASGPCAVALKVVSSGFMLNPTLTSVTVAKATPRSAGGQCTLQVGDEILQINQQPVPGARATAVKAAWSALKAGPPPTLRIRRAGSVMTVTGR